MFKLITLGSALECSTQLAPQLLMEVQTAPVLLSGTGYYKCDWAAGIGFSNPQTYTPSGGAVSAPIDLKINKQVETLILLELK